MSWRRHDTHRAETQAVKAALKAAGFPQAHVGHGTGTAWGWLEITVSIPRSEHWWIEEQRHCAGNCPGCSLRWDTRTKLLSLVQSITGRTGDYNGNTNLTVTEKEAKP